MNQLFVPSQTGGDGATGAGAGFGTGFFFFFASVAFFIPFFLRAGASRFAFLDFFADHLIHIAIGIIPSIVATFRAICGLTNINWSEVAAV